MKPKLSRVPKCTGDTSKDLEAGLSELIRNFDLPTWRLLWDSLAETIGLPLFLLDEHDAPWLISSNACEDCVDNALYYGDLKQRLALADPDISLPGPYRHLVAVVPHQSAPLYVLSGSFCPDHPSEQPQTCPSCGRRPPSFSAEELRAKQEQLTMIARIVEERLSDKQAVELWYLFERLTARWSTLRKAANTQELYELVAEAALDLSGVEAVVVREIRGRFAYRVVVRGSLPVTPMEIMQVNGRWGRSVDQGRMVALSSPMDDPGMPLVIAEPLRKYRAICCPLLGEGITKAALFIYGRSMPIIAGSIIFNFLEVLRPGVSMVLEVLGYECRVGIERRVHNAYWELIRLAMEHRERKQLTSAMADLAASLWGVPVLIREPHLTKPGADLEEHPLQVDGRVYGFVDLPRVPQGNPELNDSIARFCEYLAVILMIHDLVRGTTYPAITGERSDTPVSDSDQVTATRFPLSPREQEIVTLISHGQSNKQIARELGCRESTVKTHVSSILQKMNARDRTEAAIKVLKEQANIRE